MKILLLFLTLFLFFPTIAIANDSTVNIHSESSGTVTKCLNGNCTTTGGESRTTACINGKCYESNGDLDISDDNGDTKVHVESNSGNNSISITPPVTINPTEKEKETNDSAKESDKSVFENIKDFIEDIIFFWK